jgi:serine/threonine protein kinase
LYFNNFFSKSKAMKKLNGDCRLISESNEIKLLRRLHHENIIKYFEDFIDNRSLYIIFENCEVNFPFLNLNYIKKLVNLSQVIYKHI